MTEIKFLDAIRSELGFARGKFPTNKHLLAAFAEEAGELVKACLDYEQKGGNADDILKEAVQACAMAYRLYAEGSEELEYQGPGDE